jgi:hypothetical protein
MADEPKPDPWMPPPEEYTELLVDVRWLLELLFWDENEGPEAQGPEEALSNLRTAPPRSRR